MCTILDESIELVESAVGSVHEVLRCRPSASPIKRTILVVTGNPGLAGFYAGFARTLSMDLQAEVVVTGLAGHVAWTSLLSGTSRPRVVDRNNAAAPSTATELSAIFEALDTDGSGAISASELGEAVQRLGMGRLSKRRLRAMLREFDVDGSGEIELGEFESIVSRAREMVERRSGGGWDAPWSKRSFGSVVAAQYRTLHALDDQVEHLTEVVAGYTRRSSVMDAGGEMTGGEMGSESVPLTIIAHSIGAWLLSRVLMRLQPSLLQRAQPLVLFLMPFLEQNMENPSYRTKHGLLTRAPWLIPVLARAASPLRLTPTPVRRWLLGGQIEGMDEEYVTLVEKGMLHGGAIHNYLHLARSEMYSHQATFDLSPLRELVSSRRLRALFVSGGDEWAPVAMERRLAEEGVPTTVVSEQELSHMFSCNAPQTRIVAEWVKEQVEVGESQSLRES